MSLFIIDYNTGIKGEVEAENLQEIKERAKQGIAYTKENVTIKSVDGEVLATSRWHGIEPAEDDQVLESFGIFGFYQMWDDELGE